MPYNGSIEPPCLGRVPRGRPPAGWPSRSKGCRCAVALFGCEVRLSLGASMAGYALGAPDGTPPVITETFVEVIADERNPPVGYQRGGCARGGRLPPSLGFQGTHSKM